MYTNTPRGNNGQFQSFNTIGNHRRAEGALVILAVMVIWKLGKHVLKKIG